MPRGVPGAFLEDNYSRARPENNLALPNNLFDMNRGIVPRPMRIVFTRCSSAPWRRRLAPTGETRAREPGKSMSDSLITTILLNVLEIMSMFMVCSKMKAMFQVSKIIVCISQLIVHHIILDHGCYLTSNLMDLQRHRNQWGHVHNSQPG